MRGALILAGVICAGALPWGGWAQTDPILTGPPAPDRWLDELWARDLFKACHEAAVRERRFGDVTVKLEVSTGSRKRVVTMQASASRGLGRESERCVRAALSPATLAPLAQLADGGDHFVRQVTLGEIRPLFADGAVLLPAWRAVAGQTGASSPQARRRLTELVGPDAALDGDGCLQTAATPAMQRAVELWLRANGRELSPFWSELALPLPPWLSRPASATRGTAAFVLGPDSMASYDYSFVASGAKRESDRLCLVELTPARKQALVDGMTRASGCALTDAADALVWPRPSLRTMQAHAIGTAEARACAVDARGELQCCGKPLPGPAPSTPLRSWRQASNYGCGLDLNGHISCAGRNVPAGADGAGTFTQLSVGGSVVCAVDVGHRLSCWGDGPAFPRPNAAERFLSVDVAGDLGCAITTRHAVECWSAGRPVTVPAEEYASVSPSWCGACAVTITGEVRCWDGDGHQRPSPVRSVTKAISDQCGYGCAVDASGRLSCWGADDGSGRIRPPGGTFRTVESERSYSCAMDDRGGVACWGAFQPSTASTYTRIRDRMNKSLKPSTGDSGRAGH